MGNEQLLMMVGATIAGTFFALSVTQTRSLRRNVYMAIGAGGLSLIVLGVHLFNR